MPELLLGRQHRNPRERQVVTFLAKGFETRMRWNVSARRFLQQHSAFDGRPSWAMGQREREWDLRERLMEKFGEAVDAIEAGQGSEHAFTTLPALSEALSALCLEDISNTLRVLAYGPVEDEHDSAVHDEEPAEN